MCEINNFTRIFMPRKFSFVYTGLQKSNVHFFGLGLKSPNLNVMENVQGILRRHLVAHLPQNPSN